MNSRLSTRLRRTIFTILTLTLGLTVAVSAHPAAAAQVSGADYGTTGDCRAAQPGYGSAGGIPSLATTIHLSTTAVSVVNESPYTADGQTVVRNFFLYQWMGGTNWAYTGAYTADYTRVGEASLFNAGSLL